MARVLLSLVSILLAASSLLAAAPSIAGKWDLVALHPNGDKLPFELVMTEESGKLSGRLVSKTDGATLDLIGPKLQENVFTFSLDIGGDRYGLKCKVEGDRMTSGTFEGPQASGTFEATRVATPSGVAGAWNFVATAMAGDAHEGMVKFSERDGKLSGELVVNEAGVSVTLSDVQLQGNQLTFKFHINGDLYTVDVKLDGGRMEGTFAGAGEKGTVKGAKAVG